MRLPRSLCWALAAAALGLGAADPAALAPTPPTAPRSPALPAAQAEALAAWLAAVGPARPQETFGELVVRAAALQLGQPYYDAPDSGGEESLQCELHSFQCVSLVESSVALGRCVWAGRPDSGCFVGALQALRYRGGRLAGYASRLHYFEDWLGDNAARGHLQLLGESLGGTLRATPTFFMSRHPERYPSLRQPGVAQAIAADEARLSGLPMAIVDRAHLRRAQRDLRSGDIVAIVTQTPGILISHTGLISRGRDGTPHLLHASSRLGRVVLTAEDLCGYLDQKRSRRGVLAARPLAPPPPMPP